MASHHSYKADIKELKDTSEVEIKSSVSAKEFEEHVAATLAELQKDVTLPGFRKGMAPEKLVREKIGEASLLHEAAEHAIGHAYGHILDTEKIDAIGRPSVSITKLAAGNPLEFTIRTAVLPKIEKLDYRSIAKAENAKKEEVAEVTDADVEKFISDVRKNRAQAKGAKADEKLAELTDDEAKELGDFKTADELRAKVRENIVAERAHRAKEKKRLSLIDSLAGSLAIVIPSVLIETELDRMMAQMRHDIERMGLSFDDYLKHLKKTESEMRKEWVKDAEKKVKLDLILEHVAAKEKIQADSEKVKAEVAHIKEHHKDIDTEKAEGYYAHMFRTQAVFDYLESVK